jgi:hypothetical protein
VPNANGWRTKERAARRTAKTCGGKHCLRPPRPERAREIHP